MTQVAPQFGVHPKTVSRWAEAGKIEHIKLPGGHIRIKQSVVNKWLAGDGDSDARPEGADA